MADITVEEVANLFREAARAHHRAFAAVDGEDAEWPTWYAEYLAPRFEEALGWHFEVPALAADLRQVDAEQRAAGGDERWPRFYARWFLGRRQA